MAPVVQTSIGKPRDVVVDNIESKGRRVVLTQTTVMLSSAIAAVLAYWASRVTEEDCSSSPMNLKDWFMGLFVIHVVAVVVFLCVTYAVLSVMSSAISTAKLGSKCEQAIVLRTAEGEQVPTSRVVRVEVSSALYVDQIIFHREDGTTTRIGSSWGGELQEPFYLAPHEHILEVSGSQDEHLRNIQFRTSFGRKSRLYGHHADDGTYFEVRSSPGKEICDISRSDKFCAVIDAAVETNALDPLPAQQEVDAAEMAGRTLTKVDVRSSSMVHQITFWYSDGTSNSTGPATEGVQLQEPFVLEQGEYIVSIRGSQAVGLDSVAFVTNTGRESMMYGQNDNGHGQPFWQNAGSSRQIWALTRVPGQHGGPIAAPIEAAIQAPQPVDPLDPLDPVDPEDVAGLFCCTSFLLLLLCSVGLLCIFLLAWNIVGILSVLDAGSEDNDAPCKSGRVYFWILFVLTSLNVCCCKSSAAGDMMLSKEWAWLTKKQPEGRMVEVHV